MDIRPCTRLRLLTVVTCALIVTGCGSDHAELRFVTGDDGSSHAVVVDKQTPLLFTTMLVPRVTRGDATQQFALLMDDLNALLASAESGRGNIVRLNIYARTDSAAQAVRAAVPEAFSNGAVPAVTYAVGELAEPEALVMMDAVATTTSSSQRRLVVEQLPGDPGRAHAAVLPPQGRVFVSGQAADREGLLDAVGGTMESLHTTLAYLGLSADDVVQVKLFLTPMDSVDAAEEVVAQYYRNKPIPPIVSVEWTSTFRPVEIELIAHREDADVEGDSVSYITPAGMTGSTAFSRVVEVHDGDLVFTSGLTGEPPGNVAAQIQDIFGQLDATLDKAGSDLRHMVKATYYYQDPDARSALGEIRSRRYDPERPPAASLIGSRGVGRGDAGFALDMIAVSTNPAR